MSLATLVARQEATILNAQIATLSEVKFLSEQEVIQLAAKCKVRDKADPHHMLPKHVAGWACGGHSRPRGVGACRPDDVPVE